jgi:hypothetical protein
MLAFRLTSAMEIPDLFESRPISLFEGFSKAEIAMGEHNNPKDMSRGYLM